MARIKNDSFKFSGTIGDLSFSQDEYGTIVKKKATVDKKRIENNPRSKRTRESNVEMAGASSAAKVLRLSFLHKRKGLGDRYFSGRLNGLMRIVVSLGKGISGQRKLDIRKNGGLLEEFEFVNARPLVYSIGGIKEKPTFNTERNEVYWTSPSLNRKEQITAPKEATHFKFILGAATVSNYEYQAKKTAYVAMEPKFKIPSVFTDSEPIALKQKTIAPVTLSLKLTDGIAIPEAVAVVTAVGVAFFKNVNGELLEVKNCSAMKIMGTG
ncbi:hypothetical protein O4H26_09455 [Aequorivita viscosa]|nr:hypothetical protein [Aequorivita viscosa]